jgi:pimeloyl-ACP methyl ester carboxylesterase
MTRGMAALLAIVAFAAGCKGPTIEPRFGALHPVTRTVAVVAEAAGGVVDGSKKELRAEYEALRARVESGQSAGAGDLLGLARLAEDMGKRGEGHLVVSPLPWYRDAAAYAIFSLATPGGTPEERGAAVEVHNRAVTRLMRVAGLRESAGSGWKGAMLAAGVEAVDLHPWPLDLARDTFWPTADYEVKGIEPEVARDGLGVPVVGLQRFPDRKAEPDRFFPERLRLPATAVAQPQGSLAGGDWRTRPVRLALHDPLAVDFVSAGMVQYPMAADLTTPLAHQMLRSDLDKYSWTGLVRPDEMTEMMGVYLSEPYDSGKIPVVFIHGLWSSPMAWLPAINELRADPEFRDRYQIWYAFYPTGSGVLTSVAKLRGDLEGIRRVFDPARSHAAFDRMVLVGHSLGGIVAKTLAEDSGDDVVRAVLTVPLEEVTMDPEVRARAERTYRFVAVPEVSRVVMVAAPHRGSRRANQAIGRLAKRLIRPGRQASDIFHDLTEEHGREVLTPFFRWKIPSTVDNLEPRSPVLSALAARPIAPGVDYHSIIGVLQPTWPKLFRGDLVVPYSSAHLDGAESELVVPVTHFCTGEPAVIGEIGRILREHAAAGGPG